jgi:hypothetical protein
MNKKSKFKRFIVLTVILVLGGGLAYLSFVNVAPERKPVLKEIDTSAPQQ